MCAGWGTFAIPRPAGHLCHSAYLAPRDAGHEPQVCQAYGLAALPGGFNRTRGRREGSGLTGNRRVPALVLDDGTVVDGSHAIVNWARANPA